MRVRAPCARKRGECPKFLATSQCRQQHPVFIKHVGLDRPPRQLTKLARQRSNRAPAARGSSARSSLTCVMSLEHVAAPSGTEYTTAVERKWLVDNDAATAWSWSLHPCGTTRRSRGLALAGTARRHPVLRHLGVDRNLDQPPSPGKLACRMQSHACRGAGGPRSSGEKTAPMAPGLPFRQLC